MSPVGAGSGLTRNLAIGGAPTSNAKGSSIRAGVRPVALQPLKSAGAGRVLTGEGLYAEAARSLGALNQGPAKQALFEAQLRDVDGSPLGAASDPRKAAARLASQGGVPDHKFNYTNQKPWWWDMMQERSQKLWELWNYNWQKALSDSLIKISTGLFQCLVTGSEDGSVKNFLGIRGGSPDMECKDAAGNVLGMSWVDFSETFKGNAKDGNNSVDATAYEYWKKQCLEMGGSPQGSSSGNKNFIEARARCLGVDGKFDWLSKTRYSINCDGVNNKPMTYSASAKSKGGNIRQGDQEKMLIYVLAKVKGQDGKGIGDPFVIKVNEPKNNKLTISEDELKAINNNCVITNIGSFRAKKNPSESLDRGDNFAQRYNEVLRNKKAAQKKLETATPDEKASLEMDIAGYDAQLQRLQDENPDGIGDDGEAHSTAIGAVFADAQTAYNHCVNPKTNNIKSSDFLTRDKLVKKFGAKNRSDMISDIGTNECLVYDFKAKFEALDLNQGASISCLNTPVEGLTAAQTVFSAKITGVGGNKVYAAIVEDGEQDGKGGVFVRDLANLTAEQNSNFKNGDIYSLPSRMIGENSVTGDVAKPNHGRVYWIVTPKELSADEVKAANKFIEGKYATQINVSDIYKLKNAYFLEKCDYSWGCTANRCPQRPQPEQNIEGEFCAIKKNGTYSFYEAIKIPRGDSAVYIQKKEDPISAEQKDALFEKAGIADADCPDCIANAIAAKKIYECKPICKHLLESNDMSDIYQRIGWDSNEYNGSPILTQSNFDDIEGLRQVLDNERLCPKCNPTDAEVNKTCNFAARIPFDTARFTPEFSGNQYKEMYKSFVDCLKLLSANTSSGQELHVTGFTSYAGSESFGRCPTYNPSRKGGGIMDPANPNAVIITGSGGATWKSNFGENGRDDTEARKNCNKALSEDRAVVSLHKMIEDLGNDSGNISLASKISVSVSTEGRNDYVGFRNTKTKEGTSADTYNRYTNRLNNKTYGNGPISIVISPKGCGPEGATSGDNPEHRVIYFTGNDHQCSRTDYESAINAR